jgi:chromosome segregation ATPase
VAKLEEMQSTLDVTERLHKEELEAQAAEIKKLREKSEDDIALQRSLSTRLFQLNDSITRLAEERDFWKAQAERVESDRQALKANNADLTVQLIKAREAILSPASPPDMAPAAPGQELDFTPEFCPSAALQDESMADRNCGFCDKSSDQSACPCDVAAAAAAAAAAASKRKQSL